MARGCVCAPRWISAPPPSPHTHIHPEPLYLFHTLKSYQRAKFPLFCRRGKGYRVAQLWRETACALQDGPPPPPLHAPHALSRRSRGAGCMLPGLPHAVLHRGGRRQATGIILHTTAVYRLPFSYTTRGLASYPHIPLSHPRPHIIQLFPHILFGDHQVGESQYYQDSRHQDLLRLPRIDNY